MKNKKTPCKKACKKSCECKKTVVTNDTNVKEILKESLEDNRKKVIEYSAMACKAGEVLKFLLQMVKTTKDSYENLAKMLKDGDSMFSGIKVDLSGDVAKFGIDVPDPKPAPDPDTKPDFAEVLFRTMVGKSKYDFTGFDVEGRRVPEMDEEGVLAYEIKLSRSSSMGPCGTKVDTESTIVYAKPRMDETIRDFDRAIGSFVVCRPNQKKTDCEDSGCCKKDCGKKCDAVKKPITLKPSVKPKKGAKRVTPVIEDLKKTVLECSKYAVPSSRVKFIADHVDPKHGNFVYELRFFQKSYKSVSAETQSYERALLNVRSRGDRDDLIAKRFDKIVEGLRFNEFPKKK